MARTTLTVTLLALCGALMVAVVCSSPAPPSAAAHYCNHNPPPIPALPSGMTLVQAQIMIRHGDRLMANPATCWPDDDVDWQCKMEQLQRSNVNGDSTEQLDRVFRQQYIPNEEYFEGDCGVGQLTSIGYNQHHINGQHLREAYVEGANLLPTTLEEALPRVFLRSDDSSRTKKSGQALFDGMYPPADDQPTSQTIIPWNIRDSAVDDILPNTHTCPAISAALAAVGRSPTVGKAISGLGPFITRIAKELGAGPSLGELLKLFDCSHVHLCHGKPIPAAIDLDTFNNITYWSTLVQTETMNFNSSRYARLAMGSLITEVYQNMVAVKENSATSLPFYVFSGHDLGPIMPTLSAFGLWTSSTKWCPYAGLISFELYHDVAGDYFVRMVYQGEVQQIPMACGGQELCPWESFVQVINEIVPPPGACQDTS